jgi:predicted glycosyltransferase
MSSYEMEAEDYLRAKDMQIASLCEELHRERINSERLEAEIANLYHAAQKSTRENLDLRKRLQAYIDEADAEIQLAALRRAEAEALEL